MRPPSGSFPPRWRSRAASTSALCAFDQALSILITRRRVHHKNDKPPRRAVGTGNRVGRSVSSIRTSQPGRSAGSFPDELRSLDGAVLVVDHVLGARKPRVPPARTASHRKRGSSSGSLRRGCLRCPSVKIPNGTKSSGKKMRWPAESANTITASAMPMARDRIRLERGSPTGGYARHDCCFSRQDAPTGIQAGGSRRRRARPRPADARSVGATDLLSLVLEARAQLLRFRLPSILSRFCGGADGIVCD